MKKHLPLFLSVFFISGVALSETMSPSPYTSPATTTYTASPSPSPYASTTPTPTTSATPSPSPSPGLDCDNPSTVKTVTDTCGVTYTKTGTAPDTNSSISGRVTAVFCNVWCQRTSVTRPSSDSCTGGSVGSWGSCMPYPPELTNLRLRVTCADCDVKTAAGAARAQQLCDAIANPCAGVQVPAATSTLVCKKCL